MNHAKEITSMVNELRAEVIEKVNATEDVALLDLINQLLATNSMK